nr:RecName: Full=43 kDa cell wall protein [Phaseolus vulgaris]
YDKKVDSIILFGVNG